MSEKTIQYKEKKQQVCQKRIDELLSSFPSFCTAYEKYLKPKNVIKTRMEYLQDINTFFRYLMSNNPCVKSFKDITPEMLEKLNGFDFDDYLEWLSGYEIETSSGIKKCRNSKTTQKRKIISVRSLFHFLYVREYISCNPSEKALIPTIKTKRRADIRILEDDEAELFLENLENEYELAWENSQLPDSTTRAKLKPHFVKRDKAIIYLFLGTGLRVSELCAIDCSDISFKLGYVNVIRKEDLDESGKTDKVYLSDEVMEILRDYIDNHRVYIGADNKNHDALFLSSKHGRMTTRAVEQMVKNYADAVLPSGNGITPHKLRATFGTRYQKKYGDISKTSTVMNHSDISVTARYYLKEDEEAKEQVREMKIKE